LDFIIEQLKAIAIDTARLAQQVVTSTPRPSTPLPLAPVAPGDMA